MRTRKALESDGCGTLCKARTVAPSTARASIPAGTPVVTIKPVSRTHPLTVAIPSAVRNFEWSAQVT